MECLRNMEFIKRKVRINKLNGPYNQVLKYVEKQLNPELALNSFACEMRSSQEKSGDMNYDRNLRE